jgi:hypothetical protein
LTEKGFTFQKAKRNPNGKKSLKREGSNIFISRTFFCGDFQIIFRLTFRFEKKEEKEVAERM